MSGTQLVRALRPFVRPARGTAAAAARCEICAEPIADAHRHLVDLRARAISCACGATYDTRSTAGSFNVEVCAACHPFYTGTQKLIDTQGRVERFRNKYAKKQA